MRDIVLPWLERYPRRISRRLHQPSKAFFGQIIGLSLVDYVGSEALARSADLWEKSRACTRRAFRNNLPQTEAKAVSCPRRSSNALARDGLGR